MRNERWSEMNNNDRLTRLRYALNIKDADMVEIFKMGGVTLSRKDIQKLLNKQDDAYELELSHEYLERFLNGLITSQRGVRDGFEPQMELNEENANNLLLKKVKIALSLTSEDMLELLSEAGVEISKSELSAVLRKEGHRNYKPCGDRYVRNFLKGLTLRYRA